MPQDGMMSQAQSGTGKNTGESKDQAIGCASGWCAANFLDKNQTCKRGKSKAGRQTKAVLPAKQSGLCLLPIIGIVDMLGPNVELSAQSFYQCLCPFYLEVGWAAGFTVGYNTDTDSLTAAVPCSAWYDGPLSLPFFGWLYLAVVAAEAVV